MCKMFDDDAVKNLLKLMVKEIRCSICDKGHGTRMRYCCGHTACGDCAEVASCCVLCLSPPRTETASAGPVLDPVLTARVKHVSELLQLFETTLDIDVIRRQRIYEKLKIEKDIFPECIQAPQTYGMRHKVADDSLCGGETSKERKEIIFPGELVGSPFVPKMDNTKKNVVDWLGQDESSASDLFPHIHNKYQPRRPFSDLRINSPFYQRSPIKKRADTILEKARENNSKTGELVGSPFVPKMDSTKENVMNWLGQDESSDSDIMMINNHTVVIEDTQIQPRRAFHQRSPIMKRADTILKKARENNSKTITKSRKRPKKTTTTSVNSEANLATLLKNAEEGHTSGWKSVKRAKKDFDNCDKQKLHYSVTNQKNKKEESGMMMINDHTAVIEDTQIQKEENLNSSQVEVVDKDRDAWLAVLAADDILTLSSDQSDLQIPTNGLIQEKQLSTGNHSILVASAVPGVKCYPSDAIKSSTKPTSTKPKEVLVTVKTDSLLTTIKIDVSRRVDTRRVDTRSFTKTSKSVQTDQNEEYETKHPNEELIGIASKCPLKIDSKVDNYCSEDLFGGQKQYTFEPEAENVVELNEPVPICESESESENEAPVYLTVIADVHKSMDAV